MNKTLKNFRSKLLSLGLAMCVSLSAVGLSFADSTRVVTLGANLTKEQKQIILDYFGVKESEVVILEVNNAEERQYLEGIASEAQIGNKTYSCAYVEPTKSGSGLNIKTANVTWVNSSIVATAMSTAGMTDANVVIAANFPVSGTGALTGIMKAFEDATGEELDEDKKELATEELVTTGGLAEDDKIGQDVATGIVNDVKTEIIKNNTKDSIQIAETITNVVNNYNITLSDDQIASIQSLMEKIAAQDYNYNEMKDSLEGVKDSVSDKLEDLGITVDKGFFENIGDWFSSVGDWFSGLLGSSEDLGILDSTNDSLLGEDAVIDATNKDAINLPSSEEVEGFFAKIWNWFTGLFSNDEIENTNSDLEQDLIEEENNNTSDDSLNSNPSDDNSQNDDTSEAVDTLEQNSTSEENVNTESLEENPSQDNESHIDSNDADEVDSDEQTTEDSIN